jgi:prophage antirepressor-like protein
VRAVGEPWFVAKDVTDILGFKRSPEAVAQHVLPGQKSLRRITVDSSTSGYVTANTVNEAWPVPADHAVQRPEGRQGSRFR